MRLAVRALLVAALMLPLARAAAQQPQRDSTARRDSIADTTAAHPAVPIPGADTAAQDTIPEAPYAHAEQPAALEIGPSYHWDRRELAASGAFTVAELLERIPGVTVLRPSWIASPTHAMYQGNGDRVRVFYDGLEYSSLDPRMGGLLDLSRVQLWTLEEMSVVRGADEVRVYLRSWRVDRRVPYTRVDIATGDLDTQIYRGFFGRRFRNHLGLQLAGEQYGTNAPQSIGGGDALVLFGRLGWSRGPWSADVFLLRNRFTRDAEVSLLGAPPIDGERAKRLDTYVRAGYGDPERGAWAQVMASLMQLDETTPTSGFTVVPDNADTTTVAHQYMAAAGFTRWGARLSLTDRLVTSHGGQVNALVANASLDRSWFALAARAELRSADSSSSEEITARLAPLPFLQLTGAVGRRHGGSIPIANGITARAEAGVRVLNVWLSGGVLRRTATILPAPVVYDPSFAAVAEPAATGAVFRARGKVYQDLGLDANVIYWSEAGAYRPRVESRAEAYLDTRWLSRFPRGNFGLLASLAYQYRDPLLIPVQPASGDIPDFVASTHLHEVTARLEIRIVDAVLFYQQRLGLVNPYTNVPGFIPPRQVSVYGVRWDFFN
ncbi:MAG TPA: TonB-dependent receptor plug domain-containing protein [Gemmatimonadaceae bacterium]|nr:TonB-dependent receptor plug domain-containing protein [Gemmatimonadaceae bacterium]